MSLKVVDTSGGAVPTPTGYRFTNDAGLVAIKNTGETVETVTQDYGDHVSEFPIQPGQVREFSMAGSSIKFRGLGGGIGIVVALAVLAVVVGR